MNTHQHTHAELAKLAENWLKRSFSQNGHNCNVAFTEGCSHGENADVIGFRHALPHQGSVVIEVKVSRADFLKDRKKKHRIEHHDGMGKWRYYLCPTEMIDPSELPEQYGLLWVSGRNRITVIKGALEGGKLSMSEREKKFELFRFSTYNQIKEQSLLIRMITRFDEFNDMVQLQREYNRINQKNMQISSSNAELQRELNIHRRLAHDSLAAQLQSNYLLFKNGLEQAEDDDFGTLAKIEIMNGIAATIQRRSASDPDQHDYLRYIQDLIKREKIKQASNLTEILKFNFKIDLLGLDVVLIHEAPVFSLQQLSQDAANPDNVARMQLAGLIEISNDNDCCAGTKFKQLAERYLYR